MEGGTSRGRRSCPAPVKAGRARLLVLVCVECAISVAAWASVQIANKFDEAPLVYVLSALAAVVYVCATVGLARSGPGARRLATVAVTVELIGVLVVGTISLAQPDDFPDATVWSGYGEGYGFVPLVLPVLGLLWLRHTRE